jgi:transposase
MLADRYIGIDVHKRQVVVAAVNEQQQQLFAPEKVVIQQFKQWVRTHLRATDHVAIEATTNSWAFYDALEPIVKCVSVANTFKLKMIASSSTKTDKYDALVLARLSAAQLLPTVWIPPQHVRDLRNFTQHRSQLIQERSAAKNRLHAILHRYNLDLPDGNPFKLGNKPWWKDLPISNADQMQIHHYWMTIEHLNELLAETEAAIAEQSVSENWCNALTYLMQLPGIGLYTGMTILAAIGDIQRFSNADKLVGYSGLGARVHASADHYYTGKITKEGRSELRAALIASAWVAVRWSDHWRGLFQPLAKRIGKQKAITAIARKLLVVIWHVLSNHELDRDAQPVAIARSLMSWSSAHHITKITQQSRLAFVKQRLELLGILRNVSSFQANGRVQHLSN